MTTGITTPLTRAESASTGPTIAGFGTEPRVDEQPTTQIRNRLIGPLRGTVLEIGPGTGQNLHLFDPAVRWIGVEPNVSRHLELLTKAARMGRPVDLRTGRCENIDLPDGSVDAVVGTLVLCSVTDVARSLAEIRRVLRPGGRYVFVEHVGAAKGSWRRRGQRLSALLAVDGCRPDRDTLPAIGAADFALVHCRDHRRPGRFGLWTQYIYGFAVALGEDQLRCQA